MWPGLCEIGQHDWRRRELERVPAIARAGGTRKAEAWKRGLLFIFHRGCFNLKSKRPFRGLFKDLICQSLGLEGGTLASAHPAAESDDGHNSQDAAIHIR